MTNRFPYDRHWGSDGAAFVVDPETDATHPSGQGGAGKTAKGWVIESEPEEWENYNIKLRADRELSSLQGGVLPWDAEVTYKLGAITRSAGILYVSLKAGNLNNTPPPSTPTAWWSEIKFKTAADYTSIVAAMVSSRTSHTTPDVIAHGETIGQLGGSTKAYIDNALATVDGTRSTHALRTDNPHVDTAINIGTLPTSGGDFTGRVNYTDGIVVGTNNALMQNSTTFVSFKSNAGAIGIGIGDYQDGGRWQNIFTAASFPVLNAIYHNKFVMPTPDLHLPLMNNLLPVNSVGSVVFTRAATLAYTDRSNTAQTAAVNTPAFELLGMKLAAGQSAIITASGLIGSTEGCISYTLNGAVVVQDIHFTNNDLISYVGTTGNVKNFRVWSQRLTPRQKLRIPK